MGECGGISSVRTDFLERKRTFIIFLSYYQSVIFFWGFFGEGCVREDSYFSPRPGRRLGSLGGLNAPGWGKNNRQAMYVLVMLTSLRGVARGALACPALPALPCPILDYSIDYRL
jgi:hypothetical protein